MYVFSMTGEIAEEFFRRVQLLEVDNEDNRTKILMQMAREGLIDSVMETQRTKAQYVSDLSREFKVLNLLEKKNEDK